MTIRIREVDAVKHALVLTRMQADTFPSDAKVAVGEGLWWLATDHGVAVGFACMTGVESWEYTGYISRVGVTLSHRGQGLQRRLMQACERKARQLGWVRMISTTYNNPPSANNFIRLGYRTYEPSARWGADGTVYWIKEL